MHKIILTIALLFTSLIYAQEYKIKKIESPQYGNIAKGKTRITITDSLIIISD
ncbi:hypothetical protein ACFS5J_04940 [Flavobacterium chuncheonense]|uniref:Uncharacterized protein n=1 Tax=Flavobacterium chuncheonense TaxID=2026653 RepID=A0ABW5YJV4_9FLAO